MAYELKYSKLLIGINKSIKETVKSAVQMKYCPLPTKEIIRGMKAQTLLRGTSIFKAAFSCTRLYKTAVIIKRYSKTADLNPQQFFKSYLIPLHFSQNFGFCEVFHIRMSPSVACNLVACIKRSEGITGKSLNN